MEKSAVEEYFNTFRKEIVGINETLSYQNDDNEIIYADWTASGRLFHPIENRIIKEVGPWAGNVHSGTSHIGEKISLTYQGAREIIKKHVNANEDDILITYGSGMTGVMAKFLRILGLLIPEKLQQYISIPSDLRPIVFLSHMEHHSNHTIWLETICETKLIPPCTEGLIDIEALNTMLQSFPNRKKIVSITACSNVTGIITPFQEIADIAHENDSLCFVDFACSAPYVNINMHKSSTSYLDAIFFSPHKFLGGPGSPGVLVFNKKLYENTIPDVPGGGTVTFTDPWEGRMYKEDIEKREDGGTPSILQTIRAAMAIKLKEEMDTDLIAQREQEINEIVFKHLEHVPGLVLLANNIKTRLPIFSFYIKNIHYNLVVKLLSDRFGIQARGGCSCAGTYGHYLLNIDKNESGKIRQLITQREFMKPGWIRISFHPTSSNQEIKKTCLAILNIALLGKEWKKDYYQIGEKLVLKVENPRVKEDSCFREFTIPVSN